MRSEMSTSNNYSPLRTLEEEEEEAEEDDLDLGPIRKVRYQKSAKNRYHDLFQQYNVSGPFNKHNNVSSAPYLILFYPI